ncbi:MAG: translation initiation factor IF-2 subunit gamma [Candidatus Aenigmatarchaeota archaeon]
MVTFKNDNKTVPEINIGTVGHVDNGKTSLVYALTAKWSDTHSEEMKRGITIRLGYAECTFYYCEKCKMYTTNKKCSACFSDCVPKRKVSFVDAPGHETLMATVLSGSALMDGALLVIAANEECPQPQTAEHMKVLDIAGIDKIVIVQNKVDLVTNEEAIKNYKQIKEFVKGTVAENAPVIPISAIHSTNIDILIEAIEKTITTPDRDLTKSPRFYIARSFDVNKPGTAIKNLIGGIIGGSLVCGKFKVGDEIEMKPGVKDDKWSPLHTKIIKMMQFSNELSEATSGGLLAIQTDLDPSMTKSDSLAGNIVGLAGSLPEIKDEIKIKVELFDHVLGVNGFQKVEHIRTGDSLMMTVAIAKTIGLVESSSKNVVVIRLKLPVCAEKGDKISISRQVSGRWHLIGYGSIL